MFIRSLSKPRPASTFSLYSNSIPDACIQAMVKVLEMAEDAKLDCLAFDQNGETFSSSTYHEPVYCTMDIERDEAMVNKGVKV